MAQDLREPGAPSGPAADMDGNGATALAPMPRRSAGRAALVGLLLLVVLAVPPVVALGAIRHPTQHSLGDIAQTEMRVRDVPTRYPPSIGLPGRIGTLDDQGSHPGPVSFYALWPTYRLLGETTWALGAAAVVVHLAAIGVALWLAWRRGGTGLVLGVAVLLALVVGSFGGSVLTEPWNPYLPVLWWLTFLLAAWSVLSDDLPMLPVAAAAGSFCMQTHVPYLGLVGVLMVVVVAVPAVDAWRRRREPGAVRAFVRWTALAGLVGLVLWLPPLIDQLWGSGNLSAIVDHFGDPPETTYGMRFALEVVLDNLDVRHLVPEDGPPNAFLSSSSVIPGTVLLVAWVASVVVAVWLRLRGLRALHLLVGLGLVLGTLSVSRIFGSPGYYLVLWSRGLTALVLLAIGCTAAALIARVRPGWAARSGPAAAAVAGLALLGVTVASVAEATGTEVAHAVLNDSVDGVTPDTVRALQSGPPSARYLLRWDDRFAGSTMADSLAVELERRGIDIRYERGPNDVRVRRHRTIAPARATQEVRLEVGSAIARWRADPRFREIARHDPRSPAERRRYVRLRAQLESELRAAELDEVADAVAADDLEAARADRRLPAEQVGPLVALQELPRPVAVFLGPVTR